MKYPVKVLILDTVMDRGGAEAMTMNYFRNMDRSKVTYDFLVHRDYKAAYEDEIESLGGKIYRICPPYPWNYFRYKKEITQLFKAHPEYQIIHCNMMELGYFAYKQAKKCGITVRICHAHIAADKKNKTLNQKIWYFVRRYYRRKMNKYITHRFACGADAGKYIFGEQCTDEIVLMRNAIDAEKYRYDPQVEEEVRQEFNLKNEFVVGHVGRFFEQKNHEFLIDIFDEIVKKNPNAVLILVGGGEQDNARMNRIKEKVSRLHLNNKVIFTGVRNDVNRLMQAFNVFVLPSFFEGFPVVMVEAQAAGLKCLISDRVPSECDITGNVEIIPLSDGEKVWADHILSYKNSYRKLDMYQTIVNAGYDIKKNARWLERFYIDVLKAVSK